MTMLSSLLSRMQPKYSTMWSCLRNFNFLTSSNWLSEIGSTWICLIALIYLLPNFSRTRITRPKDPQAISLSYSQSSPRLPSAIVEKNYFLSGCIGYTIFINNVGQYHSADYQYIQSHSSICGCVIFNSYFQYWISYIPAIMKQLAASMPLAYMLPNAQFVTALPYIDEDLPQMKSKIQYLIKWQQNSMEYNEEHYLKDISRPITAYLDSQQFQSKVATIKAKMQERKPDNKEKNVKSIYDEINASMLTGKGRLSEQNKHKIQKALIGYENNIIKQINLQLYQKLGPLVQKECISALDKKKQILVAAIEKQKQRIEQINKDRQYQQLEARERQQTIRDRLQVMIHKKRKLQQQ